MICDWGDVVVVPFPFTDLPLTKSRPALVLSARGFNRANHHSIFAMITTAMRSSWPSDVQIADLSSAGLPRPSVLRWKVFTVPNDLIRKKIGALTRLDRAAVFRARDTILLGT